MTLLQALIIGIVQGATEFLPISSSGHITLVPFIFGWEEPELGFVVAVHIGTLAAVAWFFREEIAILLRTVLHWKTAAPYEKRLIRFIAYATVPAVIVGLGFERLIGDAFDKPVLVSLLLGVTGYWLMSSETVAESREGEKRSDTEMRAVDAVLIGVAQAAAILPGISRSGSTIAMGMRLNLTRVTAARFSFLMSIPIIFGAAIMQIPDMLAESEGTGGAFIVGIVSSAVSGFFAVKWFLGVVQRRGLRPFGIYCFGAMIAGLLTALARG